MGVYRLTGYHNKKPLWSRHEGDELGIELMKLYYTNGECLYCQFDNDDFDDDCVTICDYITEGYWKIGSDPLTDKGGISTAVPADDLWPNQIKSWKYADGKWRPDHLLTVTGKINLFFTHLIFTLYLL